jgi:L-ascorbate metabolism protein UlaG (beta-lactamase superfamily)
MNGSGVLIDPGDRGSGDLDGELVYCTHEHPDHTGGISTFMDRNPEAVLVTNQQVAEHFKQYSDRIVVVQGGGSYSHGVWGLEFIEGEHGLFKSSVNLGVIIRTGDHSFGHCGDTVTFKGFYHAGLQTLAIPITGVVTASPSRALSELEKFDSPLPTIVLMHWVIRNPRAFCRKLTEKFPETRCIIPERGKLVPIYS